MANRIIKQRFTSLFLLRCFNSLSNTRSISSLSSVSRIRPMASAFPFRLSPAPSTVRFFTSPNTNSNYSTFVPLSPDLPDIPAPDEMLVLEGCDFKHWLIVMDYPDYGMTREDIIDSYVKTLTSVVGSEEEARKMIYSVSTKHYYAFGVLMSEELSYKMRDLEKVQYVLPDAYLDAETKDYGGEPFINGEAVPYDPKYHEMWMRNNPCECKQGAAPNKMEGMVQNIVGGMSQNLGTPSYRIAGYRVNSKSFTGSNSLFQNFPSARMSQESVGDMSQESVGGLSLQEIVEGVSMNNTGVAQDSGAENFQPENNRCVIEVPTNANDY